jgi:hypothetical protein
VLARDAPPLEGGGPIGLDSVLGAHGIAVLERER